MLIAATEVIDGYERMSGVGTLKGELRIDWAALQRHKRSFTDPVPDKREQAYAKQGIDTYHDLARFTAPNSVEVDGTKLKARQIVIAAGDAAGGPLPLTPVAALEAHVVVDNLLKNKGATVDYTGIPSVVFTLPPLARVGLLEAEAKEQGLRFKVKHQSVPGWFTARRVNESCYAYKILVEEDSGRILGAHLIGPEASEVINLFGFAMRSGLTAADLKYATFAYPTAASDIESMLP